MKLRVLDERIEARARETRGAHAWWPCAEGCDHCCRSLPRLPEITETEWERLHAAVTALPAAVRAVAVARIRDGNHDGEAARIVCPLLDRERGTCLVYEARPIACRTYGFYTDRDAALSCTKVTSAVDAHDEAEVVWGNAESIAHEMKALGPVRSIDAWLDDVDARR